MKHTPEQLSGMSDVEVNLILAKLLNKPIVVSAANQEEVGASADYCTNWAATGPLMVKCGISLIDEKASLNNEYMAASEAELMEDGSLNYEEAAWHPTKPLRAVVECLILVLQGELI